MAELRICSIPECGNPLCCRGYCQKHYIRFKKYGNPLKTKIAPMGEPTIFLEKILSSSHDDSCLIWPFSKSPEGYGKYHGPKNKISQVVSRIICFEIKGPPPTPRHDAAHECGNSSCANPNHISWKTRKENCDDQIKHGTRARGSAIGVSRLTENEVLCIRKMHGDGVSVKDIQKKFSQIGDRGIRYCISRRTWKHI